MAVTVSKMLWRWHRDYTNFRLKLDDTKSISPDENGLLNFCKVCTETLSKYAISKRETENFMVNSLIYNLI